VRQGNRDVLSLPSQVAIVTEVSQGKVPLTAVALNYLRNNQMKLGIHADELAQAIANEDTQAMGRILAQFGVGLGAQAGGR
jgi:predicted transcriptional regulator